MKTETLNYKSAIDKCEELAALVARHTNGNGAHATAIDSLLFMRECNPVTAMHGVTEPLLTIVVQGRKEVLLNEEAHQYGVAQYLVVSVDLPLSGCAVEATPDKPYLSFKLKLDSAQLCEIIAQTSPSIDQKDSVSGWFISDADSTLIDCAIRLTKLLETPQDIPFLAPMVIREIYYRLLIRHFKQVTSMSPLQYQKQLRLSAARQIMLSENVDATQAAHQVGYESISQFSREYSRMFGAPPIRDIERLRVA